MRCRAAARGSRSGPWVPGQVRWGHGSGPGGAKPPGVREAPLAGGGARWHQRGRRPLAASSLTLASARAPGRLHAMPLCFIRLANKCALVPSCVPRARASGGTKSGATRRRQSSAPSGVASWLPKSARAQCTCAADHVRRAAAAGHAAGRPSASPAASPASAPATLPPHGRRGAPRAAGPPAPPPPAHSRRGTPPQSTPPPSPVRHRRPPRPLPPRRGCAAPSPRRRGRRPSAAPPAAPPARAGRAAAVGATGAPFVPCARPPAPPRCDVFVHPHRSRHWWSLAICATPCPTPSPTKVKRSRAAQCCLTRPEVGSRMTGAGSPCVTCAWRESASIGLRYFRPQAPWRTVYSYRQRSVPTDTGTAGMPRSGVTFFLLLWRRIGGENPLSPCPDSGSRAAAQTADGG